MAIEIHFDAVDCAPIDSATVMVLRDGAELTCINTPWWLAA